MPLRTLTVLVALLCAPAAVSAVTARDIVELSKAGLSDEVLVALIEADRTIFTLDAGQILELRQAGVSEAVLLRMLRSRRDFEEAPVPAGAAPVPEPAPHLVVIEHQPAPPVVVPVMIPYWIPVMVPRTPPHAVPAAAPYLPAEQRGFGRFINEGGRR